MKKIVIAAMMLAAGLGSQAAITLPEIVGDNMVLQQQTDARIWGWATPGATVEATASWTPQTVKAKAGADSLWVMALPTPSATAQPQTLRLRGDGSDIEIGNILIGEVWLAGGQSNMEMPLRGFFTQFIEGGPEAIAYSGKHPEVRMVTVPKLGSYEPQKRVPGAWKESRPENAGEFSALAYFFACSLNDILGVPVGIISCSYGGSRLESWLPQSILDTLEPEDVQGERDGTKKVDDWHRAAVRYNAMLLPVARYNVAGFLWNQGESNVGDSAELLTERLGLLSGHWRELWGNPDLPFYYVEMPPWDYGDPDGYSGALFREGQHIAASKLPRMGIVCTSDLVYPHEVNDVHACRKREIGERMSWLAAADVYGIKGMPTVYPRFKSMTVNGDKATLYFSGADSGFTPNKTLEGFEACGEDGVWHPAEAFEGMNSRDIHITCPEAGTIKEVRYNFRNFRVGNIHNNMGLPLIPFRSSVPTPKPTIDK